jgi:hypothetical protein
MAGSPMPELESQKKNGQYLNVTQKHRNGLVNLCFSNPAIKN